MTEQARDEAGRFLASLFSTNQQRAVTTEQINTGLQDLASEMEKAKEQQGQQLTPEQERMSRGEFLRLLLLNDNENEEEH